MHSPILRLSKRIILPKEQKLQEEWRQKQLKMLYTNGRPIFGAIVDEKYVSYDKVRAVF